MRATRSALQTRPRGRIGAFMLVALVAATLGACARPGPVAFTDAHKAAMTDSVTQFFTAYGTAMRDRDWDTLTKLYADDPRFHWVEDGVLRATSQADIAKEYAGIGAGLDSLPATFQAPVVTPLAPGVAAFTVAYTMTMYRKGGVAVPLAGITSGTLLHTSGGWRFLNGHSSTRRDTAPGY